MREKSEIDELFFRLMGYYPAKAGQAYEMISAAALGIVKAQIAEHNKFMKGESGGRPYQLDGLLNGNIMVESKDYTIDDKKVGRPDLQKLQGALSDLSQIKEGYFTSATNYSRDAITYANGTETNVLQKKITTVDVRPSTVDDEKGRVKRIFVTMRWSVPNFDRGQQSVIFAEGELYDKEGNVLISIAKLSRNNPPQYGEDDNVVSGSFPIDAYIRFYDILVPIKGIAYTNVPIERGTEEFSIEGQGNATILIKSDKLGVDKLISDIDLKRAILQLGL